MKGLDWKSRRTNFGGEWRGFGLRIRELARFRRLPILYKYDLMVISRTGLRWALW